MDPTTDSSDLNSTDDWERVTPSKAGFAPDLIEQLDQLANDKAYRNLHSVVIVRNGKLVAERYYEGLDERWGQPLGMVNFTHQTLHDLRSISKSVVSLLYGIALDEGKVPPLDQPLLNFFPQYAELAADPMRRRITVAHALSMQLGLEWNEDLPYSDPRNSEIAMERALDRCRFVLERPIVDKPGTQWTYSGGATALLAALIKQGTGESLLEYARSKLFLPLGIRDAEWITGHDGIEVPASGLRLRPRDLAKLGRLVLDQGFYNGVQLVPVAWIATSLKPCIRVDDELDYGYHWWIAKRWRWVVAFGNGGQRMTLLPKANIVLVVTAGNYNTPDAWKVPVGVLVNVVLPSLA